MKKFTLAALAVTALVGLPELANAAGVWMCAADISAAARGPRQVTPSVSPAVNPISFDANGCGQVPNASVAWFTSQGYVARPSGGQVSVGPFTFASGVASPTVSLPPNSYITAIVFDNSTGAAAPSAGGVRIGTTQTGNDVVTLISASVGEIVWAVDPSTTGWVNKAVLTAANPSGSWLIQKRAFSGAQQLFIDTPGAWGTSALSVTVFYNRF